VWFAGGGDIIKMGPFTSYDEAEASLVILGGKDLERGARVWFEPNLVGPRRQKVEWQSFPRALRTR